MPALFSPLNTAILFVYLTSMVIIGLALAGRQKTSNDFFLAGRKMPWWAVAMSMYASLTSAVTYMGLPGLAYAQNISFIVICVVSPLVAPLLILLFYPFYQRLGLTTSYEYVGRRFGLPGRMAASALFMLARLGWLGLVIYAPAITLSVVCGLPVWQAILVMGIIATGYTVLGGISADIWTDVVQFVIMLGGAVWVSYSLMDGVPGGLSQILTVAGDAGRLYVGWEFSLTKMTGLMIAFTFVFQLMQDYGTDQTTVQRLMTTPTLRGITKAILFNAVVDFVVIGMLLFIGVGMFAYYQLNPAALTPDLKPDQMLPFYIIHALPDGISGLLVTAILAAAMSSMDSGISSLGTVVVNDFVRPWRKRADDRADLKLARALTLLFGVFGTALAFYVHARGKGLVASYMQFMGLFAAPVLALFLLGMLTRKARFGGWVAGTVLALVVYAYCERYLGVDSFYQLPISCLLTFGGGYIFSLILNRFIPQPPHEAGLTLWDRRTSEIQ